MAEHPARPPASGHDTATQSSKHATGEPTLAEVQAQHPTWQCARGISGLYHAHQPTTGLHVTGEDPRDLLDQIKTAQARHAYGPFIP